jgi:hypothetical protein
VNRLTPESFPLALHASLVPLLSYAPALFAECTQRADACDLEGQELRWLVAEGGVQAVTVCTLLDDAISLTPLDPTQRLHHAHVTKQVHLTRRYVERGWRDGLYVPWRIIHDRSFYTNKTHMAPVERSKREPYLLRGGVPACKGYIRSPGDVTEERFEITCKACLRLQDEFPGLYKMAEPGGF